MTYTIELLEKQAFGQELVLKHLREGVPSWADDLIISHRDLLKEMRSMKVPIQPNNSPKLSCGCCCCARLSGGSGSSSSGSSSSSGGDSSNSNGIDVSEISKISEPGRKESTGNDEENEERQNMFMSYNERLKHLEAFFDKVLRRDEASEGNETKDNPNDLHNKVCMACNALIMYLSKIDEQPMVARYKKLCITNQNFKKSIVPIENYDDLLSILGFEKKGNFYNYVISDIGKDRSEEPATGDKSVLNDGNDKEVEDKDGTIIALSSFLQESIAVMNKVKASCSVQTTWIYSIR